MKFKKNSVFILILIVLFITGCSNHSAPADKKDGKAKDVVLESKTDSYETMEELHKASDLIVIGTKSEELKSEVVRENGNFSIAYTISSFHINKILKNEVNENKDNIMIFENQAYDEVENEVLHIGGYENMLKGNLYILYLKKAEAGYYIPLAVTIGKVPLTKSELNKKSLVENSTIKDLHKQIQEFYKSEMK